ncbi:MAG: hypothetical protein ACI4GZ_03520 [Ruminococcus sp.]
MPKYKIAELTVEMSPRFEETAHWYKPYEVSEDAVADFELVASDEQIDYFVKEGVGITPEIAENLVFCNGFHFQLLKWFGTYIHSSAVLQNGRVYLFSAKSGVGKSTLTSRITRLYPTAQVINDDKPSIKLVDGVCCVYGTPFAGGTDKQLNLSGELGAVVFLERADKDELTEIGAAQSIALLLDEMPMPKGPKARSRILSICSDIIEKYPFYLLKCTNTDNAAKVAYEVMKINKE